MIFSQLLGPLTFSVMLFDSFFPPILWILAIGILQMSIENSLFAGH